MLGRRSAGRTERGQIVAIFALLLPLLFALSAFVIGIGNWFVHAKHLQTKADAGALAGGGGWEFPCGAGITAIDQRIAALAHLYSEPNNPQVGGVPDSSIHARLNVPDWYDDDSNSSVVDNLDICDGMRLDVKVTEDNSFPLASLIPLFPDIKRKAVVELEQAEGITGLLPIAVRAPEPISALAIFYNESDGTILDRKYLIEKTGPTGPGLPGLPAGLQGWSTEVSSTSAENWASVNVAPNTGVVIAISYRGACDTWGGSAPPSPPAGVEIQTTGVCLEDGIGSGAPAFANVDALCNQNGAVQLANCYYTTGTFPNEAVQSGLHFIRGYTPGNINNAGPPELRDAHLTPGGCTTGSGSGYFASFPAVCGAGFSATIDAGTCFRLPQGGGWTGGCVDPSAEPTATETRIGANVELKWTLVHGTANNDDICDFGPTCDVSDSGTSQISANVAWPAATLTGETRYAVALRIRFKETDVASRPACSNTNFNGSCEWYFLGSQRVLTEPSNLEIFTDPVQRIFRGNTVNAGSIRMLRLKSDPAPCSNPPADPFGFTGPEGSHVTGAASCFVVEVGLKGGLASDADDEAFLFSDGIGASQMGYLDCTSSGPQNIVWELMNGCPPLYAPNKFNTNPLCPPANSLFTTPNPGPPFDNGDWPPLRCVKTRPTSQGQDLIKGLNGRFFFPNDPNPPPQPPNTCPPQSGTGYTQGRNYWKHDLITNPNYGYQDDSPAWTTHFDPLDDRLVTIFLTTPESFTGSGQNTYPVTGAIGIYISGYGTVNGSGQVSVVDPCGDPPPSDVDLSGGASGGRAVWGHFVNLAILSANATGSGVTCNPGGSSQPCVPVLVE